MMPKRWIRPLAAGFLLLMVGCAEKKTSSQSAASTVPERQPTPSWQAYVDSLTLEKQRAILSRLLAVAEKEGWGGAVRYCHAAAETLTTYQDAQITLQRVALRNRNPKNALADSLDRAAYNHFLETRAQQSLVWEVGQGVLRYYRPIYVAMPQCLKCHGGAQDLDGPALAQIRRLYPGDKATGFAQGDLRGLWKATLRTQKP
ncbi:MAG: DUF3365 domain-containing protein [Bacteroidetes bacterium]|nr:MAG: DUF3365 domain-containing protein [Bacteroidota bacterium]